MTRLFVIAILLSACGLLFADNDEENKEDAKIRIDAVADAPDPFSPFQTPVVISTAYLIRPTDGLKERDESPEHRYFIEQTTVIRNASDVAVRTIATTQELLPPLRPERKKKDVRVTVPVSWDGTSESGVMLPDGNYTYSVTAELVRTKSAKRKVVGRTSSAGGAITKVSGVATITASVGGTVAVTDPQSSLAGAQIVVPPGALTQETVMTIADPGAVPPLGRGYRSSGPAVDFGPDGVTFTAPVTIMVPYDEAALQALRVTEESVGLFRLNASTQTWDPIPVTSVDTANNVVIAQIASFSTYQTGGQVADRLAVDIVLDPVQAGQPSDLAITVLDEVDRIVTGFIGMVRIDLTGTNNASGVEIYPSTTYYTFAAGDAGEAALTDAVVFARAGSQSVRVAAVDLPSVEGTDATSVLPASPATLAKVSGDNQMGLVNSTLAAPLVTRVTDLFGNPVPSVNVEYARAGGDAPHIEWTRQFGSVGPADDSAIAVDVAGNIYVAGRTRGTFPGQSNAGGEDSFVRKYDASGNEIWTRQFGTSWDDRVFGTATDQTGVYVAGFVQGVLLCWSRRCEREKMIVQRRKQREVMAGSENGF